MKMMDPAFKLFGKTIPVVGEVDGEDFPPYESNDTSNSDLDDKVSIFSMFFFCLCENERLSAVI